MQLVDQIEKQLWSAADLFRANTYFASNEFFMPAMGMTFLRNAHGRFLKVRAEMEEILPTRGGKKRHLTKVDFSGRGLIHL